MKCYTSKALCTVASVITFLSATAQTAQPNGEVDDDGNLVVNIIAPTLFGVMCALAPLLLNKIKHLSNRVLLFISLTLGVIVGIPIYTLSTSVRHSMPSCLVPTFVFIIGLCVTLYFTQRKRKIK